MNELRLLDLASHVVAWHNRHPLARRIGIEDLHSLGYVVLPFTGPGPTLPVAGVDDGAAGDLSSADSLPPPAADEPPGATLRERAIARAQGNAAADAVAPPHTAPAHARTAPQGPLKRVFDEKFIPFLSPQRVARWAARQGLALNAQRRDGPVRRILPRAGTNPAGITERWVMTAQIDAGRHRTRVLVGAGAAPSVLGHRLWSLPRLAGAATLLGALVAVPLLVWRTPALTATPVEPAVAASAAGAGSAAGAAPGPVPEAASAAPAGPVATPPRAPGAASAATPPLSQAPQAPQAPQPPQGPQAPAPAGPLDVEPTLGRVELPSLGRTIDERRRAAALALEQAASAASTSAPLRGPPGAAPGVAPARPAAPGAVTDAGPTVAAPTADRPAALIGSAFAVSTRLLRTRAESEQLAEAMRALLIPPGTTHMHVDVIPAGADWRVVGWPYADRARAEKARALLAARGMKVEVVGF